MAAKTNGSASLRSMIQEAVTEDATLEGVRQMIADVFQTEQARKVVCPNCGVEHKILAPDVKTQVSTLIDLLSEAEGKAAAAPTPDVTVIIERPSR